MKWLWSWEVGGGGVVVRLKTSWRVNEEGRDEDIEASDHFHAGDVAVVEGGGGGRGLR